MADLIPRLLLAWAVICAALLAAWVAAHLADTLTVPGWPR